MRDRIIKAIMNRYYGFTTLRQSLDEDTDTVIVNLKGDLNDEVEEEQIMEVIRAGIDPFYKN